MLKILSRAFEIGKFLRAARQPNAMFIPKLMSPLERNAFAKTLAAFLVLCSGVGQTRGQFVSFNDHYSGPATHPNATAWNVFGTTGGAPGTSGPLRDIASGATLGVVLTITTNNAVQGGTTSGAPSAGTPAYSVFNNYVDFGNGTLNHAIQIPAGANVSHTFTGLNPAKRYSYKATGIRGEATGAYTNRWTLFELVGAVSFIPAHSANTFTNGLAAGQVALNTGNNNTPTSGDIIDWENIAPDTNGTITITATQFTGAAPGNSPLGPYGYGIQAERLEEFVVAESAVAITAQPTNQTVVEGRPAFFTVSASGIPAPNFQWYKGETLIPNATNANYAIPAAVLQVLKAG